MTATELTTIKDEEFFAVCGIGGELAQQWQETRNAIAKMQYLNGLWCRSRTPWSVENITLKMGGQSPWKQIRQVAAELEAKRNAISEAKWLLLRLDAEIKRDSARIETESDEFARKMLAIEIGEKQERIAAILRKFAGAMQDIADLERLHDALIADIGTLTTESIQAAEHGAHLRRAVAQAVRSVRYHGNIDTGNQEYLEQCGVNPSVAVTIIKAYLTTEANSGLSNTRDLQRFINEMAEMVLSGEYTL